MESHQNMIRNMHFDEKFINSYLSANNQQVRLINEEAEVFRNTETNKNQDLSDDFKNSEEDIKKLKFYSIILNELGKINDKNRLNDNGTKEMNTQSIKTIMSNSHIKTKSKEKSTIEKELEEKNRIKLELSKTDMKNIKLDNNKNSAHEKFKNNDKSLTSNFYPEYDYKAVLGGYNNQLNENNSQNPKGREFLRSIVEKRNSKNKNVSNSYFYFILLF